MQIGSRFGSVSSTPPRTTSTVTSWTPTTQPAEQSRSKTSAGGAGAYDFSNISRRDIPKAIDEIYPEWGLRSVFLDNPGLRISIGPEGHVNHFGDPDEKVDFVSYLEGAVGSDRAAATGSGSRRHPSLT